MYSARTRWVSRGLAGGLACAWLLATPVQAQERTRVVNEGGIRDEWMLADGVKLAAPGYPAAFAARGDNVCVAVGYLINPDGSTGDYTLLKSWTSSSGDREPEPEFFDAFSRASAAALSQWRFKPRPEVGTPRPVMTVATMTFMGKQAEDPAGLRARCAVSDLASLIEQAKVERAKRGDLNRSQLDQTYRNSREQEMRANQARSQRSRGL